MPAKKRPRSLPANPAQINFDRHARVCTICRHPQREAIEEAFIDWVSPLRIHKWFDVGHYQMVYRHAHAAGLFELRRRNARIALERLIENAEDVKATPESVIRAVQALSRIDDNGRWTEPVRRVVISKRAVLSQQKQSSANENSSRRAITYQGEISSQEVIPLESIETERPALPTREGLREEHAQQEGDGSSSILLTSAERAENPATPTKQTTGPVSTQE
jgi:hypothetical protein